MPDDLEVIERHFENDRFAASSGVRLVELRPGFARTSLEVEERHLNSVGIVQGGEFSRSRTWLLRWLAIPRARWPWRSTRTSPF